MKKILLASAIFILTSCNNEEDLTGYWVNEDQSCSTLCGFTISKKESANSGLFASFDKGPFYLGSNGPVIKYGDDTFLIKGALGDFPFKKKDGYLYGKNGEKYTRSKQVIGRWTSKSKSCESLCEFDITRSHDDRLLHVNFNDASLYGYYDGVLYRKDDKTLIIKGNGVETEFSIEGNGDLKSINGTIYEKKEQ